MAGVHAKNKKKLQIWLDEQVLKALDEAAARTGLTRTELVLRALRMAGGFKGVPSK